MLIIYYTIPRAIRELWHRGIYYFYMGHYTIPRAIRELWRPIALFLGACIIPYQELLGNYDSVAASAWMLCIIPYQELLGNYDRQISRSCTGANYTIPRAIRELWRVPLKFKLTLHYTIPRAIRELWLGDVVLADLHNYTIPRAIRELWLTDRPMCYHSNYTIPRAIRELWPALPTLLQ